MAPPTFPLQRASPSALARVLLALAPLLLGGCSGTRFGEALSRSFPSPSTTFSASRSPSPADASAASQGSAPANPGAPPASPNTAGAQPESAAASSAGPAAPPAAAATPATAKAAMKPAAPSSPGTAPSNPAAEAVPAGPQRQAAQAPAHPAPYRVTIRLPLADPSAPAEVVTEALRAAGVPFEVETIERMGGGTSSAAPAMAPVVPSVPQVRPAPPPR